VKSVVQSSAAISGGDQPSNQSKSGQIKVNQASAHSSFVIRHSSFVISSAHSFASHSFVETSTSDAFRRPKLQTPDQTKSR
jgi:hypothetical protein